MRPWCRAMPPIICTSKCRMPVTRFDASRTVAKASGRISCRISCSAFRRSSLSSMPSRCFGDHLFEFRRLGLQLVVRKLLDRSAPKSLICSTIGLTFFKKMSLLDPNTFFTNLSAKLFTAILSSSLCQKPAHSKGSCDLHRPSLIDGQLSRLLDSVLTSGKRKD